MGTPEFAVPTLESLLNSGHEVTAVYTQPDRPRGRGHRLRPTPVAEAAQQAQITVHKPERLNDRGVIDQIKSYAPEAIVVAAYGQIVPNDLLVLPKHGCINLHPSLLPRWRGASPLHAPLLHGEEKTGITTMLMDEGLDTGDILLQKTVSIPPLANVGDLHDLLAKLGAELMLETLDMLDRGDLQPIPQDDSQATYAPKVEKEEIDWHQDQEDIVRKIRGLSPFPGIHTFFRGKRLKILRAAGDPNDYPAFPKEMPLVGAKKPAPGSVLLAEDKEFWVAAGSGCVKINEVHPQGRNAMDAAEFLRGYALSIGEVMGNG